MAQRCIVCTAPSIVVSFSRAMAKNGSNKKLSKYILLYLLQQKQKQINL